MPLPRPSLVLQAYLKPQLCTDPMEKEFKRSFMVVAQSVVHQLPEDEAQQGNVLRLSIRMHRPYWDAQNPEAQTLWDGSVHKWLVNLVRNLNNTMKTYNQVLHPLGAGNIEFSFVEFEFDQHILARIALEDNQLPASTVELLENLRRLMAEGVISGDAGQVASVCMPSRQALQELEEALAQAPEEISRLREAARQAEEAAHAAGEEPPEPQVFEMPEIPLDYSRWGICYADGTVEEFACPQ